MSELTTQQEACLAGVRAAAHSLAENLGLAEEAGISQAVLLPELIKIMREAGLLPRGLSIPFFGGA